MEGTDDEGEDGLRKEQCVEKGFRYTGGARDEGSANVL